MRLLVVEDERSLREDIAKKLRLSGYEVDACEDGEEALTFWHPSQYDLILLDLNLPKVDGMTVPAHASGKRPRNPRPDSFRTQ